ncbi:MAG: InlB B-repeat-containing protein [Eggerthellaceae bacterium]|nr:InlB B-repeat-containing protein [Eggerthellaceae bacterium]
MVKGNRQHRSRAVAALGAIALVIGLTLVPALSFAEQPNGASPDTSPAVTEGGDAQANDGESGAQGTDGESGAQASGDKTDTQGTDGKSDVKANGDKTGTLGSKEAGNETVAELPTPSQEVGPNTNGDTVSSVGGDVTLSNDGTPEVEAGSLWITLNVTVNGGPTTTTLADGTYRFLVYNDDGEEVEDVQITIANGVSKTKQIDELPYGTYMVKEDTTLLLPGMTASPTEQTVTIEGVDIEGANKYEPAVFTNDLSTTAYNVTVVGGSPASTSALPGETVSIKANEPGIGEYFDTWTSKDGVSFVDAKSAETTFIMPKKNVTVTAKFESKARLDVAVTKDGVSQAGLDNYLYLETEDGNRLGVVFEYSNEDQAYVYNPTTTKGEQLASGSYVLRFNPPASSGYTTSSTELDYYEDVYQESTTFAYYTVEFVNYDDTVLQSGAYTAGEQPKYDGETPTKPATVKYIYEFAGWTPEVVAVDSQATYKATFTEKEKGVYKVVTGAGGTWTEGSSEPLTFTFKRTVDDETTFGHFAGILVDGKAVPEKDSSRRVNWTAAKGSVIVSLQKSYLAKLPAGKHTVTALFDDGDGVDASFAIAAKPSTHTVTFDANGHGTAPAAQEVEDGEKAKRPSDPTADGYTFGGWYTDKDCKNAYDFSTPVTSDVTLYAKWTKKSSSAASTSPQTGDPLAGAFAIALALAAASAALLAFSRRRSRG